MPKQLSPKTLCSKGTQNYCPSYLYSMCLILINGFQIQFPLPCRYKLTSEASALKMKRLYFFWVCPDTHAFEWFADLLHTIEEQVCGVCFN